MFVRELDTLGIAYHSPALNPFCDKLRRALSAVVPNPKERSKRWLSTCYSLDSDEAGSKTCGPDYHVRLPLMSLRQPEISLLHWLLPPLGYLKPLQGPAKSHAAKQHVSSAETNSHTPQGTETAGRLCHGQVMPSTGRVA